MQRGAVLSTSVADSVVALIAHPLVAAPLGLVLGVGLLVASRVSFRLMRADNAGAGLALVGLTLLARMGAAVAVLWAYHAYVPEGFMPFAAGFAGGFFVAYAFELVRYAGIVRPRAVRTRTPHSTAR